MANEGNDILMRMVQGNGNFLAAECRTEVDTDLDDFVWDYYNGQFFEIMEFGFTMALEDKDPKADAVNAGTGGTHPSAPGPLPGHGASTGRPARISPADLQAARANLRGPSSGVMPGKFGRWKSATTDEIKNMKYPVHPEEFTITRFYDKASPVLFEKCCKSDSFNSISLVKRKLVGDNMLRGFLRMDFTDALVTHVSWQNAEVMKETVKFVFRSMEVKYRAVVFQQDTNEVKFEVKTADKFSYDQELLKEKK